MAKLQWLYRILVCGLTSYGCAAATLQAQAGSLDLSFDPGTGALGNVETIALQADGKILIGGDFTSYNGTTRNRIARLNTDGSLDTSFDPGTAATAAGSCAVYDIALQPDGRIILVGTFTAYNGNAINRIARINADGSFDASFNPGTGSLSAIYCTLVQPDGKIVIGGNFMFFNGSPINRIARLNADGTMDGTFNPGTGTDASIRTMALQGDGKILIGADFTTYNGTARNYIARINSDGSLDTGFDPGTGAGGGFGFPQVRCIRLQPDGKIIATGYFTEFNGTTRNRIVRLNSDGSVDTAFDPEAGADNAIQSCVIQADGKILIGGNFSAYGSVGAGFLAMVNTDGTPDVTFISGTGANNAIEACEVQPDGRLLIGGSFGSYNSVARGSIARINAGTASGIFLQEADPLLVSASPNPFDTEIYLDCRSHQQLLKHVTVSDMQGRTLLAVHTRHATQKLDLHGIPSGVYLVTVVAGEFSRTMRLVKH